MADKRITDLTEITAVNDSDSIPVWAVDGTYRVSYATLKAGASPSFSIGTVTTIEEGENARATITGGNGYPVLNLWIPKGDKGNPPNMSVGTVETLPSGTLAYASITGTAANPVLNMGIPRGPSGYVLTETDKQEITYMVLAELPYASGVYF